MPALLTLVNPRPRHGRSHVVRRNVSGPLPILGYTPDRRNPSFRQVARGVGARARKAWAATSRVLRSRVALIPPKAQKAKRKVKRRKTIRSVPARVWHVTPGSLPPAPPPRTNMAKSRKRRFSAAQRAAQKLFAQRAKSGAFRRKGRRRRNPTGRQAVGAVRRAKAGMAAAGVRLSTRGKKAKIHTVLSPQQRKARRLARMPKAERALVRKIETITATLKRGKAGKRELSKPGKRVLRVRKAALRLQRAAQRKGKRALPAGVRQSLSAHGILRINPSVKEVLATLKAQAPKVGVAAAAFAGLAYVSKWASDKVLAKLTEQGDKAWIKPENRKYVPVVTAAGVTLAAFAGLRLSGKPKLAEMSMPVLFGGAAITALHLLNAIQVNAVDAEGKSVPAGADGKVPQMSLANRLGIPLQPVSGLGEYAPYNPLQEYAPYDPLQEYAPYDPLSGQDGIFNGFEGFSGDGILGGGMFDD